MRIDLHHSTETSEMTSTTDIPADVAVDDGKVTFHLQGSPERGNVSFSFDAVELMKRVTAGSRFIAS